MRLIFCDGQAFVRRSIKDCEGKHVQQLELGIIQKKEFAEVEPLACEIVGHRIFENKEWITIAQEKWDGEMGAKYVHVIPKISILKITKLKEVKK